jgi:predicted amidohydrolase
MTKKRQSEPAQTNVSNSRRRFFQRAALAGAGLLAGPPRALGQTSVGPTAGRQRVAAVQFAPRVGDVAANLQKVESMVQEAVGKGSRWIVLPEFFASGQCLHPSMFDAHRPVDGEPAQLLVRLAKAGGAYVGGSFLARSADDVFNTFVLACPDGTLLTHDKDFPTMVFESTFFAGGEDDAYARQLTSDGARTSSQRVAPRPDNNVEGAFAHNGVGIGTAMCWEIVRHRTAKRLAGKVDLLLAASGWWTVDPAQRWPGLNASQAAALRAEHQSLIDSAPRRMARMLGVPVVHANFTGLNAGFTTVRFDEAAVGSYLGSSQIVDAGGNTIARLGTEEGVLVAEVEVGRKPPTDGIADSFWFPDVSDGMRSRWVRSGAIGRDDYFRVMRPHLAKSR